MSRQEVEALDEAEQSKRRTPSLRRRSEGSNLKSIEDFRAKPIYAGDHTRVDLAYAVYAIAHGVSESEARDALAARDLTHKGDRKRQQDYIDRTIKKAQVRIG